MENDLLHFHTNALLVLAVMIFDPYRVGTHCFCVLLQTLNPAGVAHLFLSILVNKAHFSLVCLESSSFALG